VVLLLLSTSPKSICWNPSGIGGRAFQKWVGHEGGALLLELKSSSKRTQRTILSSPLSPDKNPPSILLLTAQPPSVCCWQTTPCTAFCYSNIVLVRVTVAMMKHYDHSNLGGGRGRLVAWQGWGGEERYLAYTSTSPLSWKSGQELKRGRNLEAGADAEALEEWCLLAISMWLTQPAFLQNPRPPV